MWPGAIQTKDVDKAKRFCDERLGIFLRLSRSFMDLHPMTVEGPEECNVILRESVASINFPIMFNVPSYSELLQQGGFEAAYSRLAALLAIIARASPSDVLVTKSPGYIIHLPSAISTLRATIFVGVWRDPVEVLGSWCRLVRAVRQVSEEVDDRALGPEWLSFWTDACTAAANSRSAIESSTSFIWLDYERLIDDPVKAVLELSERVGVSLTRTDVEAVHAREQYRNWRPQSLVDPAEFGVTRTDVESSLGAAMERLYAA